jgi:hypothetical protein
MPLSTTGAETSMVTSISPNPHVDSQKGQVRGYYSPDFNESNDPNARISRHPGVLTSHRPLASDHRPLLVSPGEYQRLEGQAVYVSKARMGIKGVPKPVNGQEGSHDRNSDSPGGKQDREIEHRMKPVMGRTLAARTRASENKVSYLPSPRPLRV